MNILFCGDRNVQNGLLIAVLSLLENTQEHFDIYVLTLNITMNEKIYSPIEASFLKAKHLMLICQQDLHLVVC